MEIETLMGISRRAACPGTVTREPAVKQVILNQFSSPRKQAEGRRGCFAPAPHLVMIYRCTEVRLVAKAPGGTADMTDEPGGTGPGEWPPPAREIHGAIHVGR